MKQIVVLLMILLTSHQMLAQGGTITGISMSPNNPTSTDTIYFYVNYQFTSGDCVLDYATSFINGSEIQVHANYCIGLLAVICPASDTFKLGPLPTGDYEFNLTLTSGTLPTPCTPGVVADDSTTFSFTVSADSTAGIEDHTTQALVAYPNPVKDHIVLPSVPDGTEYSLYNISGKIVKSGRVEAGRIENLTLLASGLYILKLNTENGELIKQVVKR